MQTKRFALPNSLRAAALGFLSALCALAPTALGAVPRDHVLQWIPPSGVVDGYRVHLGQTPSLYDQILDLGVVPIDIDGIGRATLTLDSTRDYYMAVTAYNGVGESPPSNQIALAASACDPRYCDDAQQCTADDCGPNGCTNTPLPDGTFCSAPGSAYGMCMAGACAPAQCTDASHCDDRNACNGAESCSGSGACTAGTPVACGAPSQCSVPSCDPASGGCLEIPRADGTLCNDGKRSTINDQCTRGVCRGTRVVRK